MVKIEAKVIISMARLTGIVEKRDDVFVIMIPDDIVEKENFIDGEKVNILFIKK